MIRSYEDLVNERIEMKQEIAFLHQRNKELRQKSYIQVYDENLKLIDEIQNINSEKRQLINTVDQLRKKLIKVGEIADRFRKDAVDLQKENLHLKDVLKSVESFCQQYSIR